MNKRYKQQPAPAKGFTIIEVVLVLAIAGLIFLMVFIALPALQRGQRDAQRKQDLSRISVQMTNYLSSSRGAIPTTDAQLTNFIKNYLRRDSDKANTSLTSHQSGDDYKDPDGNNYTMGWNTLPTADSNGVAVIGYYPSKLCDANSGNGDGVSTTQTAPRDYAFTIKLESQGIPYCLDNKS